MVARFILSLDCEGKWGVADLLNASFHHDLTDAKLSLAYKEIVRALDEFAIPATFAFVGAFAQPEAKFNEIKEGLQSLVEKAPRYLGPAMADITCGTGQGWHGDWAVDSVASASSPHEIALHGFTHVPWTDVSDDFIQRELELWGSMSGPVRESRTFVYPRNAVAHIQLLAETRIDGYRLPRKPVSRLHSLLSEFNVWAPADRDTGVNDQIIGIPPGYFVNWQHGPRKIVPRFVSARRASHVLRSAHRTNEVAHFWLHPENIASAPNTIAVLRDILRLVADSRDRGECIAVTQAQYCEERRLAPTNSL